MSDKLFFKDLKLTRRNTDQLTSDREYVDMVTSANKDLQLVGGRANLAQAIINRLLTRKGELARLGHPNYGSRLYELVGELNNIRVQGLAEIYIRECLAQERRIKAITAIIFLPSGRGLDRGTLKVNIGIQPVDDEAAFSITLPLNL